MLTLEVPVVVNVVQRNIHTISSKLVFIPHASPDQHIKLLTKDHTKWSAVDRDVMKKKYGILVTSHGHVPPLKSTSNSPSRGAVAATDDQTDGKATGGDEPTIEHNSIEDIDDLISDLTFDEDDLNNLTETSSTTSPGDATSSSVNKTQSSSSASGTSPTSPSDNNPVHRRYVETKTKLKSGINVSTTVLFKTDTITTLRRKLFVETGIPPYRQHIWVLFGNKSYPVNYKIHHESNQHVDIRTSNNIETVLEDIPVDSMWYASKEIVSVECNEHMTISQLIVKYNTVEFYVIDLNSFINKHNRDTLRTTVSTDSYAHDLIYWGFIIKYFPMMSSTIFKDYMRDPISIKAQYPLVHPRHTKLIDQYTTELQLLTKHAPKYNNRIMQMNITSSTLNVRTTYVNDNNNINLRNLFDSFALNDIVRTCICNTNIDTQRVILIKTYKNHPYSYSHIPSNSIQFTIRSEKYGDMLLQINKVGNYKIIGEWYEGSDLMFSDVFKIINDHVVPIINTTNSFKSVVSKQPIEPMTITNSTFTNINMITYIKRKTTTAKYTNLRRHLDRYVAAGILERNDVDRNILQYNILKGAYMYDVSRFRYNSMLTNEYGVLFDAGAQTKWRTFITKRKSIRIIKRFSDIKVEIKGLRDEEYGVWFNYFQLMLAPILTIPDKDVAISDEAQFTGTMKIRHMKEMDPVLYDLKKIYGKSVVYSQICQRPHQPRIHDAPGKGRIKYWNFTNEQPMWYSCPSPKYPQLYFKVGIHPLQYCMPCCKKNPISTNPKDEGAKAHAACLSERKYTREQKNTIKSRYIKTYSKFLHPGRISRLPENTIEPLLYNNYTMTNDCSKDKGYYMFGVNQHGSGVNDIGFLFCVLSTLEINMPNFIKQSCKRIRSTENWVHLLGGQIIQHFTSSKDLVETMKSAILNGQMVEFTKWNQLFIDVVRMYWDVNVIIFVDHGTDSTTSTTLAHDSDIYLNIHGGINYIHDYFVHDRSMVVINRGKSHYPVYMMYTQVYFKSGIIENRDRKSVV